MSEIIFPANATTRFASSVKSEAADPVMRDFEAGV